MVLSQKLEYELYLIIQGKSVLLKNNYQEDHRRHLHVRPGGESGRHHANDLDGRLRGRLRNYGNIGSHHQGSQATVDAAF